ncbi:PLP-dependent aminotransferase family protein [Flavobacterium sp. CBA20B-1]|uniref:aminotransferase-like domain-containing protein n=1 Tax=unclassified Flavobacterium TaxID=196869 RepID=UPI0022246DB8|nr:MULTISPECIES: PLP-dependent aminotransferase family protein [unclassified Flavobacterium]WCM43411.1 PLP-dependent aminotransferase family protein [Flavobacterium sp. CBA20B-1]
MNSPVEEIIQKAVSIDRKASVAVYIQIAQHIINAVQRGYFSVGTLLPGTRSLSRLLKIHRNTAVAVYDELASQGWVEIIANKGTFVLEKKHSHPTNQLKAFVQSKQYPSATGFSFTKSPHVISPYEKANTTYTFNDGQTDIRLHTDGLYNRWYNTVLRRTTLHTKWNRFLFDKTSFLDAQLSNYLNLTRNLQITPKNVLVTRNTEMSLHLIAQLLLQPNDLVLVGNLSNFTANMVFSQAKATIKTIPVDASGIDVEYIRQNFTKNSIRLLYCTPQRHYPTTVSLTSERRTQLLALANEYKFAIIEDDYDYDFQYDALATPPMASADTNGLIIYLGKVGQALFPAFETGFIVAPENLTTEVKNYYRMIDPQGDLIKEQILAEVIYEGEMHRQVKKKILLYKTRRDAMCNALKNTFGDLINFNKPNGGLALFVQFKKPISLVKLSEQISKYNVTLPKHLLYQTKNICGIRLGFGHLNTEEIKHTIEMLRKAYDDLVTRNA